MDIYIYTYRGSLLLIGGMGFSSSCLVSHFVIHIPLHHHILDESTIPKHYILILSHQTSNFCLIQPLQTTLFVSFCWVNPINHVLLVKPEGPACCTIFHHIIYYIPVVKGVNNPLYESTKPWEKRTSMTELGLSTRNHLEPLKLANQAH